MTFNPWRYRARVRIADAQQAALHEYRPPWMGPDEPDVALIHVNNVLWGSVYSEAWRQKEAQL